jgi:hypothetical protein
MRNKSRYLLHILVVAVFLTTGCASTNRQFESRDAGADLVALWNLDRYPMNVYMGIAAPYTDRNRMVREAILQCARTIAISERIEMESRVVSEMDTVQGLISFATAGKSVYWEEQLQEIVNRIELKEVREIPGEGVVVIAADPVKFSGQRPYVQEFGSDGRPTWVDREPQLPGYRVAVGETLGYRFLRDSLEAADVLAAEALLNKVQTTMTLIRSYVVTAEETTTSSSSTFMCTGVFEETIGVLDGFTVLARWYDAKLNRFYSLAVVKTVIR